MADVPGCLITFVQEELTLADLTQTGECLEALLQYAACSDFCGRPGPAVAGVLEPDAFLSGSVRVEHLSMRPLEVFLVAVAESSLAPAGVPGVAAAALRALPALVRRHRQMADTVPLLTQEWLGRHLPGGAGAEWAPDLSTVDALLVGVERAVFHEGGWRPPT